MHTYALDPYSALSPPQVHTCHVGMKCRRSASSMEYLDTMRSNLWFSTPELEETLKMHMHGDFCVLSPLFASVVFG